MNTESNYLSDLDEGAELWDIFAARAYPDPKWRIQNLIPEAGAVIIAGPSGEGKSWLAMEMSKSIASGKPFLGNFDSQKSTVLYINQENSKSEMYRRGKAMGFDESLGIWLMQLDELDLNDDANVVDLADFIKRHGIEVVVIDTFRSVAGNVKDENAVEISQFFKRFKPLKDNNLCLIFIDHTRKPERFDGNAPKKEQLFGSQYKLGAIEVLLMVRKVKDQHEFLMYQMKNRLGVEIKPFKISMVDSIDEMGKHKISFEYQGETEYRDSKKGEAKDSILSLLGEQGRTRVELIDLVSKGKNIGSKNISEAIRELQHDGGILMQKHHRENFYVLPTKEVRTEDIFIGSNR